MDYLPFLTVGDFEKACLQLGQIYSDCPDVSGALELRSVGEVRAPFTSIRLSLFRNGPSCLFASRKGGPLRRKKLTPYFLQGCERMLVLRRQLGPTRGVKLVKGLGSHPSATRESTSDVDNDDGIFEIELEEEDEVHVVVIRCRLFADLWRR